MAKSVVLAKNRDLSNKFQTSYSGSTRMLPYFCCSKEIDYR
jgi:hypothetical protein